MLRIRIRMIASLSTMLKVLFTCCYRQINLSTASAIGLVAHGKLIGISTLGDGRIKYDRLACVTVGILDILIISSLPFCN